MRTPVGPSITCRMAGLALLKRLAVVIGILVDSFVCSSGNDVAAPPRIHSFDAGTRRPPARDRRFTSEAVDALVADYTRRMKCPVMADLFANCLPNTLDTTVHVKEVRALTPRQCVYETITFGIMLFVSDLHGFSLVDPRQHERRELEGVPQMTLQTLRLLLDPLARLAGHQGQTEHLRRHRRHRCDVASGLDESGLLG